MPELKMTFEAYQAAASAMLTTWEIACVRPKESPRLSGDAVNLYARALQKVGATAQEIADMSLELPMRSKWFPSLQETVDGIKAIRTDLDFQRKNEEWAAMVPCVDLHGQNGTAPYYRVRDGRELPLGETNPDAIHPRELAALQSSGQLALPAPVSDDERRENILTLARKNPDAAGYMIAALSGDGSPEEQRARTQVEREALREFREANPGPSPERTFPPEPKRKTVDEMAAEVEREGQLIEEARELSESRRGA